MSWGQRLFRVQISEQAKSCNSAQRLGNEERRALEAYRERLLGILCELDVLVRRLLSERDAK